MLQKDWKNKFSVEAGSGKNSQDSGGLYEPFGRVLYKVMEGSPPTLCLKHKISLSNDTSEKVVIEITIVCMLNMNQ